MKVHFMGEVLTGNLDDFKRIIELIEKAGHEVITRHAIERSPQAILKESPAESELYAKKINSWFKKADVIVFEVTSPAVSVGFEAATALNMSKPVIMLYREGVGAFPPALKGLHSDKLQVLGYSDSTLDEILELALDYARETADVRFNFFIPPRIVQYLDWYATTKKVPRSVYLRTLIEEDMERTLQEQRADKID